MPLREAEEWRGQSEYLGKVAEKAGTAVHVLPLSAGPYGLGCNDAWFLRVPGGRTVAYTKNAYQGELIEEYGPVERPQHACDAVRDLALSPAESRKFILSILEEVPGDPST